MNVRKLNGFSNCFTIPRFTYKKKIGFIIYTEGFFLRVDAEFYICWLTVTSDLQEEDGEM